MPAYNSFKMSSERNHDNPNWVLALGIDEEKLFPMFDTAMRRGRISEILEAIEQFDISTIEKLFLTYRASQFIESQQLSAEEPPETEG